MHDSSRQARCAHRQRACFISRGFDGNHIDEFRSTSYLTRMDHTPDAPDSTAVQSVDTPDASPDSPPPRRRRFGRWIKAILLLLFLLLFPMIIATYHDCAICGMKHTEWRMIGVGWLLSSRNRATPCSDWYREQVEPEHQHVWVRRTSADGFDIFGWQVASWLSGRLASGQFSWLTLGVHTQQEIYQKSPDPAQARTLFLKLARFDKSSVKANQLQDQLFSRLNDWIESDLKDPWPFTEEELLTPAQ
ncbi:hypothetical protein [Gimesia panareensis]|uniref:hypothetical protein n=1 Tax=Gimesia panareensis TaxID=2527978 RepID=UPI0011A5D991|nr:hypothetical protein [Gimesia panareensis]